MKVLVIDIGGGTVKHLGRLPTGVRDGGNGYAFTGGYRLWRES